MSLATLPSNQLIMEAKCQWSDGKVQCTQDIYKNGLCYAHHQIDHNRATPKIYKEAFDEGDNVRQVYDEFRSDEDILDLRPELGILKTSLREIIKDIRFQVEQEEGSYADSGNLKKILNTVKAIKDLAREIEQIERNRNYVIDVTKANAFVNNVMKAIVLHVEDTMIRKSVIKEIKSIPFRAETSESEEVKFQNG